MIKNLAKKCISVIALFLIAIVACFADSVFDAYYKKMAEIQKHNDYLINAKLKRTDLEYDYKVLYKKDGRYVAKLTTHVGEKKVKSTILYDGNDILTYSDNSDSAIALAENLHNKDEALSLNPIGCLINFREIAVLLQKAEIIQPVNPVFVNNNDNKNGFDCRLIKVRKDREICVSDKYGISVYEKYSPTQEATSLINVLSIQTGEAPDEYFILPENIRRKSPEKYSKDILNGSSYKPKNELESFKTIHLD